MLKLKKKYVLLFLFPLLLACGKQNYSGKTSMGKYNFSKVEKVVKNAIEDSAFPGAVVLVEKDGKIIFEKAFGYFTYDKNSRPMTLNTLFDLASLTKVISTTNCAMICIDRGLFKLDDRVSKYIPEFAANGKENITVRNLLLHNSGLPAFKKYYKMFDNGGDVLEDIYTTKLDYPTGTKTVYSDLGIITLGKIIEKVTGMTLDKFAQREVFNPLGMENTMYNPPDSLKKYCAPTEYDNYWRHRQIQGVVHDETASMLGGIAGHAGLFSTAEDIARVLQMLLQDGEFNGNQIIEPGTVKLFTKQQSKESTRALGWDTKSKTGSSAGDLFSDDSYGHTGFTGTSVWTDPERKLFVVFLTNRVYPSRENHKLFKVRPALHNAVIETLENK
jgi:CubicO group peptidase (beta-lactamase class C family)